MPHKPYAGVKELLSSLKSRNLKLGLLSNAYDGAEQRKRILSSGITDFFDAVVISGEVEYSKPSVEIFLYILNQLGFSPEQVIYVGDSEKYDIQGANNTGIQSILLRHKDNFTSELANYSCTSIEELHVQLEEILA
nr:HAD-IA family hydrolase [uncultured Desulfobacter sp.]